MYSEKLWEDKTSSRRTNDIEALSERLGSLQINKEASMSEYKQTDTEMSVAQAFVARCEGEGCASGYGDQGLTGASR